MNRRDETVARILADDSVPVAAKVALRRIIAGDHGLPPALIQPLGEGDVVTAVAWLREHGLNFIPQR